MQTRNNDFIAPRQGERARFSLAVAPGNQPLWRFMVATQSKIVEGDPLADCRLLTQNRATDVVNAFVVGDVDIVGLIGTTYLRLRERLKEDELVFFQPITWMAHGPVICSSPGLAAKSLLDLQDCTVACAPQSSDLMAYWIAVLRHNYQRGLEDLFKIVPTHFPGRLLQQGKVDAAILDAATWFRLRDDLPPIVTNLRTEWERASERKAMPVMGALVARRRWLESNEALASGVLSRLEAGLQAYDSNKARFVSSIAAWRGIDPSAVLSEPETDFWCEYWGMSQLTEARLSLSEQDLEDLSTLERLMSRKALRA